MTLTCWLKLFLNVNWNLHSGYAGKLKVIDHQDKKDIAKHEALDRSTSSLVDCC